MLLFNKHDIKVLALTGSPVLEFIIYAINELSMYKLYNKIISTINDSTNKPSELHAIVFPADIFNKMIWI